jgi:hypothetical protein
MDLDPAIFVIDLQDASKKLIFLFFNTIFFCLLLFEATFVSFFKDKKSLSHKIVGIKGFLTILA